jgi:thiol-disulfide isomerase/thioredoxin
MFCKSVNGKSRIIALLAVLTIMQSLTPFPCLAVLHGDVELLKTVAQHHKANFGSLMTWKGEAFEEVLSTRGDNYDYMVRSKCTFAYDKSQNAARWNKQPQEHRMVVDGKKVRNILASYNSGMVKGKSSYKYSAPGQRDGKDVFRLVIYRLKGPRSFVFTDIFTLDPRYFFADPAAGHPIYDRLMLMYDNADNIIKPASNVMYVKRVGDLVIMETWMPEHKCTEKHVFDLSVGGNVIEYLNKYPKAETVHKFQYEQQSGVWVPKSFKWMNITEKQKGAGALKTSRTIHWSNSVVNVPFEEDEFTLEKLGVKDGDDIDDHTIDKQYKYRTDTVTKKQDGKSDASWRSKMLAQEKLMNRPAPSLLIEKWYNGSFWQLDLKGKTVLLDFWGVWCAPCKQQIPFLKKLDEKYS